MKIESHYCALGNKAQYVHTIGLQCPEKAAVSRHADTYREHNENFIFQSGL